MQSPRKHGLGKGFSNAFFVPQRSEAKIRQVRRSVDKRAAEEISNRAVCEDFETFKPLFERVKRELKYGVRETRPVHSMDEIKLDEIQKGQYFIVGGQVAFVAEVGEGFRTEYDRRDSRLRVIYDNGTESSLLMRSFNAHFTATKRGGLSLIRKPGRCLPGKPPSMI